MVLGMKIGSDWEVLFDLCGWISYPSTPIEKLFKFNNGETLRELLLSPDARISAYCDQGKIEALLNRYLSGQKRSENPLYRLFSAELWLQECMPKSL